MTSGIEALEEMLRRARAGDATVYSRLGIGLFQAGRAEECSTWLEKAVAVGDLPALNLLGVMRLNGVGVNLDFAGAMTLLRRASDAGVKEASHTLAGMYANGLGTQPDFRAGWRYLVQAGRQGHVPAWRVLGILLGIAGDRRDVALSLLRHAGSRGDALAQSAAAGLLANASREAELKEARYWAEQAASRQLPAARRYLAKLPEMTAAPPPVAEIPWQEIEGLCPEDAGPIRTVRPVSPGIVFEADTVLPDVACDYLVNLASPQLMPSQVVDPVTGESMQNPVRSSYSMYFRPNLYDAVVAFVRNTVARLAEMPVQHAEPLAMLRYMPGQEYKPHKDYLVGPGAERNLELQGGQRVVTAFVYLDNVVEGGETDFPELKVNIKPARGRAVKFYNLDAAGTPNPMTLHAGCPVLKGEKWLATFWFRQQPFSWI
jgi:hypothetical protein